MDKYKSSQFTKLFFILAFLVITPLLSSSLKPTYLFLVLNILIISLGAQSGLISFISTIPEDHKKPLAALQTKNDEQVVKLKNETATPSGDEGTKEKSELLQKLAQKKSEGEQKSEILQKLAQKKFKGEQKSELLQKLAKKKFEGSIKLINTMKKFNLMPKEETEEAEDYVEDDFQENVGGISEEELYDKAETFIGNFYQQLKIQSEESWQKIDGVYQLSILSN